MLGDVYKRQILIVPFVLSIPAVVLSTPVAESKVAGVNATAAQLVHPVLIRNEYNALLHLKVDVEKTDAALRIQSMTFSLADCDDFRDLDTLSLYTTRESRIFATEIPLGHATRSGREVTIGTAYELRPGRHFIWLSCTVNPSASLSHKVDAVCTSILLSNGATIRPSDSTPDVRKRIGVALRRHWDDGVHTYRIPALTTTKDGTLLAVYDMRRRRSRDLQEDIDIGLSRSTDGGQTWEPPKVIMDMGTYGGLPEEQNGVSDPGILVDENTGEIFCTAVWMWGKPGEHQWHGIGSEPGFEIGKAAQFLMVRSTDDGRTWTQPENLTRKLKRPEWWVYAPAPQGGITLRDGTLVMPTDGRDAIDSFFSCITYSRDHGRTWTVSEPAFRGGSECQAVELSDGSIMLNMRTLGPTGYRGVAITKDLGKTWTMHETHLNTLIEPRCNGSLYRFDYTDGGAKKSVLLFANPQSTRSRVQHSIQVSFDEGKTWPERNRMLLDYGRGRGYPSISRVDDRHVGIIYEGSRCDVTFERIPIDELVKGR